MTGGKRGIVQLYAFHFSFPCIWIVLFEILLVFFPSTFCCLAMRLVNTDFLGSGGCAPQKWESRGLLQVLYNVALDISDSFNKFGCLHVQFYLQS